VVDGLGVERGGKLLGMVYEKVQHRRPPAGSFFSF
jgi:hypothetical protein